MHTKFKPGNSNVRDHHYFEDTEIDGKAREWILKK
jgi:hypothetical protein